MDGAKLEGKDEASIGKMAKKQYAKRAEGS